MVTAQATADAAGTRKSWFAMSSPPPPLPRPQWVWQSRIAVKHESQSGFEAALSLSQNQQLLAVGRPNQPIFLVHQAQELSWHCVVSLDVSAPVVCCGVKRVYNVIVDGSRSLSVHLEVLADFVELGHRGVVGPRVVLTMHDRHDAALQRVALATHFTDRQDVLLKDPVPSHTKLG